MGKRIVKKTVVYEYQHDYESDSEDSDYVPPSDSDTESDVSMISDTSGDREVRDADDLPSDPGASCYQSEAPSNDAYESSFIDDRSYSTYSYTSNPGGEEEIRYYYWLVFIFFFG